MTNNQTDRIKRILVAILSLVIVFSLFGLWRAEKLEKEMLNHSNVEKDLDAKRRREGWVQRDGVWYKPNPDIEKFLIIGIDSVDPLEDSGSYVNSNQSDFLLMAIMNSAEKTTTLFQINRDTMTEIPVLGVSGQFAGSIYAQLALAHTYGNGLASSCENTVSAVEDLLGGVNIDHYISMNMGVIPYINDMLGGVEVTVDDDFSGIDPYLVRGQTVLLEGNHALSYLRIRRGLEDSSNINRMNRHRQYLEGLFSKGDELKNFALTVEQGEYIGRYICSDCTIATINTLAQNFAEYQLKDYVLIAGEAVKGTEFIEFYPDGERLQQQIIDLFYVER